MIRDSRLRIILLGYIVRGPLAGLAWHYLQYVLALTRLGHEVYFFEDSDDYASCYNPETNTQSTDPSYGLQFLSSAMGELGLPERWAYYDAHKAVWRGPCADQALAICATADLFLNVSAVNPIRPWLMAVPVRVLVDTDPAFTQVRHLTSADARTRAACHTAFFSFGENLSAGLSSIPDDGFQWQATRQPVVLDAWAVTPAPPAGSYTSVMLWEAYPAIEYHGRRYGPKADSFGPFLDLPTRAGPVFELAFGSRTQPGKMMKEHGWTLIDPREPSRSLGHYRDYIQASRAEFGVAKHGYVVSRSGWFSERSALYLASGRPVLVQDTGFGEWLRTSEGVLPFRTVEDVLAGRCDQRMISPTLRRGQGGGGDVLQRSGRVDATIGAGDSLLKTPPGCRKQSSSLAIAVVPLSAGGRSRASPPVVVDRVTIARASIRNGHTAGFSAPADRPLVPIAGDICPAG